MTKQKDCPKVHLFQREKNALLPMREKLMDERQEKKPVQVRADFMSVLGELA